MVEEQVRDSEVRDTVTSCCCMSGGEAADRDWVSRVDCV